MLTSDNTIPTLRSSALLGFSEHCRQNQLNPTRMLATADISPDALNSRELRLPYAGVVKVLNHCAEESGNPLFSFTLSHKVGIESLGPLGLMASHCQTIGDSLAIILKYFDLYAQQVSLKLERDAEEARLYYRINLDDEVADLRQITELGLGRACSVLKALTPEQLQISRILIQHKPTASAEEYARILGLEPCFEAAENCIVFPAALLDFCPAPPSQQAQHYFDSFLQQISENHSNQLQHLVTRLLRELIPANESSACTVAKLLGLHPRSLQRQLKQQDTDFRTLLEQVRYDMAVEALKCSEVTLSGLSDQLGYSELSAFSRAFKRWSGISPQLWREQYLQNLH